MAAIENSLFRGELDQTDAEKLFQHKQAVQIFRKTNAQAGIVLDLDDTTLRVTVDQVDLATIYNSNPQLDPIQIDSILKVVDMHGKTIVGQSLYHQQIPQILDGLSSKKIEPIQINTARPKPLAQSGAMAVKLQTGRLLPYVSMNFGPNALFKGIDNKVYELIRLGSMLPPATPLFMVDDNPELHQALCDIDTYIETHEILRAYADTASSLNIIPVLVEQSDNAWKKVQTDIEQRLEVKVTT